MGNLQLDEEAIFGVAREIPSAEARHTYLAQVCGDNTALLARVEALLRIHDHEQDFLQSPAVEPGATAEVASLQERTGQQIGRYKLLQQIGEGGFGVVFMAEQQQPVFRKVALKVVKPGMDTKEVVARFEAERQALAMMDHPNIAKVYDGGATESGRPYFVMELVRGIPITDYCDSNDLTTHERLQLFTSVCNAVQHAHHKGVIHRDIKPTNVLVTLHDGEPVVKVIDFGVAKAIHHRLTDKTLFTNFMQMIGTPLYMSPEQAEMSGLDIDTRTDIYSLGVLLYELLVGTTPFDRDRLRAAAYDEIRRIIREEEPLRPSHRISTLGGTITHVCSHRKTEPKKLSKLVRGELDWIVMKALEKDRNRRYESAGEFARDIQRHLTHEPVQAGPPTILYRLRKYGRRNRSVVGAGAIILLAILVGLGGSVWGMVRASVERDRAVAAQHAAQQEEAKARKAASDAQSALDIIANVLGGRDARYYNNPERTAMEVLDSLAARLDSGQLNNPYVEANLRYMLGRSYHDSERFKEAHRQLKEALALQRTMYGNDHKVVADTLLWLAINAKRDTSLAPQGEEYARESVAIYERMAEHGVSGMVATAYSELSATLFTQGKSAAAVEASEKAVAIEREVSGSNTDWTLLHMAHCYGAVDKTEQEVACFEQAYSLFEHNVESRGSWLCQQALTDAYAKQGQCDKAFDAAARAVQLSDSQGVLRVSRKQESLAKLATRYRELGDRKKEIECLRQVMDLAVQAKDLDAPKMFPHRLSLAQALHASGHETEAATLARETQASLQRFVDGGGVLLTTYADRVTIADLCRLSGSDRKTAEDTLAIIAAAQPFKTGDAPLVVACENGIKARVLGQVQQPAEAIECARAQLDAVPVEWMDWYNDAEEVLVELLESAGLPGDACQVREKGVRARASALGGQHFATDLARVKLAQHLCAESRYSEAEQILDQVPERMLMLQNMPSFQKRALVELLVDLCQRRGDGPGEKSWREKIVQLDAEGNHGDKQ